MAVVAQRRIFVQTRRPREGCRRDGWRDGWRDDWRDIGGWSHLSQRRGIGGGIGGDIDGDIDGTVRGRNERRSARRIGIR